MKLFFKIELIFFINLLALGAAFSQNGFNGVKSIYLFPQNPQFLKSEINFENQNVKSTGWEEFSLIYIDTLFIISNQGLTKIFVELNDYKFILTTNTDEIKRGDNIFPIKEFDITAINIAKYINPAPEDSTIMRLLPQGPAGSDAFIVVGDLLVPGKDSVDYVLELQIFPSKITLKNYPNPFNNETTIQYTIPDEFLLGVDVRLVIYNSLGQKVKALVSSQKQFPGTFEYQWKGFNRHGNQVATGLYFYQLIIANQVTTKRMLLIK